MKRKIVLFGGTFDPIHYGHTGVAENALRHIGAEKVVFIPARRSPHKHFFPVADASQRLDMIALAIADNEKFCLSDCELKRPEPSYTLQTVRHFHQHYGQDAAIYWLTGADSVDDLPAWYKICELINRCNLCVMLRAGFQPPDFDKFEDVLGHERLTKLKQNVVPTPLIDISSTQIRKRLSLGRDVTDMLHPAVLDYIRKHNLYQPGES